MDRGHFPDQFGAARLRVLTGVLVVLGGLFVFDALTDQKENSSCVNPASNLSIFVAGDAVITQPWSNLDEPEFLKLVDEIRTADVAVVNLEMVIHDFNGYPQADVEGTYMAARPGIARELAWAGFDMVGHANNHTYDYGAIGLLETLQNVDKAGLLLAGSGRDLQGARSPVYFPGSKGTVALVAASSTFAPYKRASLSRPDLHGRPGLNPLSISRERLLIPGLTRIRVNPKDLDGNLRAIRKAEANADLTVLSMHAHKQGPWLVEFAHQAIDAGVDVFFGHGPHEVRGVEIYKCRPIFYGLGDFVFQNEQIELLPSEFYERYGLGDDATPEDAQNARSKSGTRGFPAERGAWEGIAATVQFAGGDTPKIRLIPVDLGFGKPLPIRGRPRYADKELGKKILGDVIAASRRYGTEIEYVESENIGIVRIGRID